MFRPVLVTRTWLVMKERKGMVETDLTEEREATQDIHQRPYPGTPRWVKILVIVAILLILIFVVMHLAGGGMGPGMHMQ
jgi:hypothetical protein